MAEKSAAVEEWIDLRNTFSEANDYCFNFFGLVFTSLTPGSTRRCTFIAVTENMAHVLRYL